MAVTDGPQIALSQIHVEAGGSATAQASLNDADIRDLIGKGAGVQMAMSEWYGASAYAFQYPTTVPVYSQAINQYGSGSGFGSSYNTSGWGCSASTPNGFTVQEHWQFSDILLPAGTYTLDYNISYAGNTGCYAVIGTDGPYSGFSNNNSTRQPDAQAQTAMASGNSSVTFTSTEAGYFGLLFQCFAVSNNPQTGTLSVSSLLIE